MISEDMTSLGDLALEMEVKKSLLIYYFNCGLLIPEYSVGGMKVFKKEDTVRRIKKIENFKKQGKRLKEIKELL